MKAFSATGPAPPKARHLAPISPHLNEKEIIEQLASPCTMDNSNYSRVAGFLSMIDVHDRRLQRSAVVQTSARALAMIEFLRQAEALTRVLHSLVSGKYTPEETIKGVSLAIEKNLEAANETRILLHEDMVKVAQCPYEGDPVH